MANKFSIVKSAARGMVGFGEFLGVVGEGESWSALGCLAMDMEYAARAERHGGKAIQFNVHFESDGVVDQASFDAYWLAQARKPVVNVLD